MAKFENKVIAITGGASGMGLATTELLFTLGARVSVADINQEALDNVVPILQKLGPGRSSNDIFTMALDVRSSEQVDAWIKATLERFGRLDGAANVAGVRACPTGVQKIRDTSNDGWSFLVDTNLTGVFYCMRAQLQAMANGGSIVNVSSLAGVAGDPSYGAYSASKHGILGLSKTAAKEEGNNGIRINVVAPGFIETPLFRSVPESHFAQLKQVVQAQALNRQGTPEDVSSLIAFLLSDDSSFITGQVHLIDGGLLC